MQDHAPQPDPFKPEMPRIPGVNDQTISNRSLRLAATALAAFAAIGILVAIHSARNRASAQAASPTISEPLPQVASDDGSTALPSTLGPKEAAKVEELAKPWSTKKFTFKNPVTHEDVPAMIVRLPGTSPERNSSYWAFALDSPYERCELDLVTDLNELASHYSYRAGHPMVLAPCDDTVYDPLRMATSPTGALVRGEIVHGVGIRPPLAIEIHMQGNSIVATNME